MEEEGVQEFHPLYLVVQNCMGHLQDFLMVLLQLEESAISGVAVFKISLRVEKES